MNDNTQKKVEKKVEGREKFDKDLFKRSVVYNVKTLYRKDLEEADMQQIFQAVSLAIKDQIMDNWIDTQKAYEKQDPKMVYYMSMEFLMGRALGNNIINLQAQKAGFESGGGPGAGCSPWKRRSGKTGCMFPGFSGNPWIPGLRLRHPLPLWYVQAGNQGRLSGRSA